MPVFVPHLKARKHLESVHFTICIVGSRKILQNDDYGSAGWSILAPNLTIYGFDADADACEAANLDLQLRQVSWSEHHIPLALSDQVDYATLYVTNHVSLCSLYPPNAEFNRRFHCSENSELDFTVEVETTTMDAFFEKQEGVEIDFLQVDVQGADLNVLRGAKRQLEQGILGIQVEVEFAPMYINQPLFSDVDPFLRGYGYHLFDLDLTHAWSRNTRACSPFGVPRPAGQLIWADASYLRDPLQANELFPITSPTRILKLACIADILGFPDYALELLGYLTLKYGDNPDFDFTEAIKDGLVEMPGVTDKNEVAFVLQQIRDRIPLNN